VSETPAGPMTLGDLIRLKKGGATYDVLEAMSPLLDDGTGRRSPGAKRWEQLQNKSLKNFPDPDTIRRVAVTLAVTEQVVMDACAISLGLTVTRSQSRLNALLPPNVDLLTDAELSAFLTLLHIQVQAHLREAGPQEAATPPRRHAATPPQGGSLNDISGIQPDRYITYPTEDLPKGQSGYPYLYQQFSVGTERQLTNTNTRCNQKLEPR
jgi:hypothetical protein